MSYEDLTIDQGADVLIEVQVVNRDGSKKNLTGFSVEGALKQYYGADSSDAISFTSSIVTPASNGVIHLELSAAQTLAMDHIKRYVYDVNLGDSDSTKKILHGLVSLTPSVTDQ